MQYIINIKIELDSPHTGVSFGLQEGKGKIHHCVQIQQSFGSNLCFTCSIPVKIDGNQIPNFTGPFSQGPADGRFIYLNVGKAAGQNDSPWVRRMKIPLKDISKETILQLSENPSLTLYTKVPGIGKDGGPNCATIKPFSGWKVASL
jgi:hypothetical protein